MRDVCYGFRDAFAAPALCFRRENEDRWTLKHGRIVDEARQGGTRAEAKLNEHRNETARAAHPGDIGELNYGLMMTCGCFAGMTVAMARNGVGQSMIDVDPTANLPGLDFLRASYMKTLALSNTYSGNMEHNSFLAFTARAFAEIIFDLYLFELEEFIRGPSLAAALLPFTSEVLLEEDASTRSARVALEARRDAAVTTAQALEAAFPPRPVFPAQQSETEDDL